jgi:primosomal protein N' (replication factor Y) (superfamily II helicase)
MDATAFPQNYGELLPDRIFAPIRKALSKGSVLFLVPRKGYAHAVACKSCRNIALCQCGGKISQPSTDSGFICSLCSAKSSTWSCAWCKSAQSVLLGRGSIRFAQEIGRAFPGFAIYTADAEHPVKEIAEKHSLVLATAGMAPAIAGGYQAVVIIDGDGLFAQLDLRAQERARESIMQASSLSNLQGKICVVIDSAHPIVAALSRWNLSPLLSRELREREQALLPPYVRAITLDFEDSEVSTFITGINGAVRDGRLPPTTRILGPNKFSPSQSRVILTVDQEGGEELADFVVTYRKKRATSKKSLPHMRIDPYSLNPSQS